MTVKVYVVTDPNTEEVKAFPLENVVFVTYDNLPDWINDPGRISVIEERLKEFAMENAGPVEITRDKLIMIASTIIDIVMEKNADYGDSWQRQGIHGTLCRIADKLLRVETLADGRQVMVVGEEIPRTLADNIGYSFLALIWLLEREYGGDISKLLETMDI